MTPLATPTRPISTPRIPSPTPTVAEARNDRGLSARRFRHLCANGSQAEIEELLEQWPGSYDELISHSPSGSPLAEAAMRGQRSLLEYLVNRGFSLFGEGPKTVIDAATSGASQTGDMKVLDLLVELGWDVNSANSKHRSTLAYGLSNEDVVRWFLAHDADPNGASIHGCTATTRAAEYAPLCVVKLLVDHGGTVVGTDAVAQAVFGHNRGNPGRLEVVEYLLNIGAPIDTYLYANSFQEVPSLITMYGLETPLQLATREGKQDMVELLLRRGADKKIKGQYFEGYSLKGGTALEIAEMKGFKDIANLLRGVG